MVGAIFHGDNCPRIEELQLLKPKILYRIKTIGCSIAKTMENPSVTPSIDVCSGLQNPSQKKIPVVTSWITSKAAALSYSVAIGKRCSVEKLF